VGSPSRAPWAQCWKELRLFAQRLLSVALPPDVDALKIEVPQDATEETPWRLTRVSRQPYFYPVPGNRTLTQLLR